MKVYTLTQKVIDGKRLADEIARNPALEAQLLAEITTQLRRDLIMRSLDEFTAAYLECALWSSTDNSNPDQGGDPLDDNYTIHDIEPATLTEMLTDCARFQADNATLINDDNVAAAHSTHCCDARAGHDFWLTRSHHGAGFWDGDWREPAATTLTDAAHAFGEYSITAAGDGNGQVHKM